MLSLPVSIALHGLVFGAVILLSARSLSIARPPEPSIPIVFPVERHPLASRASGEPAPKDEPRETVAAALERPAPPRLLDAVIGPTLADPTDTNGPITQPNSGALTALSGENTDGPGGSGTGASTGPVVAEGAIGPRDNLLAPRLVLRVEPAYPEPMRKAHVEGFVVLKAIISAAGTVEDVQVVKSVNPLLDEEARHAVEQWRYRPATLDGRSVSVALTVKVEFRLR